MVLNEQRTVEQLREHYEIEKELANRLRNAPRQERRQLYTLIYDELYRRVPHHPQLTRRQDSEARRRAVAGQIRLLKRFLHSESTFMEIGPGDCSLSQEVARIVQKVYAVDVSTEITTRSDLPENFVLIISDGSSIAVPENIIDVAYSYQVMEHLHPDDALEQLRNIHKTLRAGGVYICITPNRLTGPHDISKYYDQIATGFHLKEYTTAELNDLFISAGFSNLRLCVQTKGLSVFIPVAIACWIERLLSKLAPRVRMSIARRPPVSQLLGITLVAVK